MLLRSARVRRRGSVLPLVVVCVVALLGFVALAVDVGLMMVARNQCQNAADAAVMAGARTLNGDDTVNNKYTSATTNALAVAANNSVLSQPIQATQVTVSIGSYSYNSATSQFVAYPSTKSSGDNWTLAQAQVSFSGATRFGTVFGLNGYKTTATATAVHRPRDVVLVTDFSGSMRFDSMLAAPHGGTRVQSMNPESVYPLFGHYADTTDAALAYSANYQVPSGEIMGQSNDFTNTTDGPPVISDFYQDATAYGTSTAAFTAAPDSYATAPAGIVPLKASNNSGSSYATNVKDVVGGTGRNAAWELDGYAGFPASSISGKTDYSSAPFAGYTQGPRYWGKTFFLWPPDPRAGPVSAAQVPTFLADFGFTSTQLASAAVQGIYQVTSTAGSTAWGSWTLTNLQNYLQNKVGLATSSTQYQQILRLFNRPSCDWRALFFYKKDGVTPLDDNSLLYDSSGNWYPPRDYWGNDHYRINYNAILNWIKNVGPSVFPPQLRSGGVLYYDSIPSSIDNSSFPPTDQNQRFWKEYIDEVLGLQQFGGSASSPQYQVLTPYTGYGDDYAWGTATVSAKPTGTNPPSMSYSDNPQRPKLHFWFGPMSLLDFLGNYNLGRFWWPGTTHESATWQCKIGMAAALNDMKQNHPNDNVALIFFSSPKTSYNGFGFYNTPRVPLSQDYASMQNSLWFSPRIIANKTPEIRPYDNSGLDIQDVPRANGGTCYAMPLMLAYNQFSGNSGLQTYASSPAPSGQAGGLGRKGAQKLIVFETDGMVNTTASANFTNGGAYSSYYNVRLKDGTSSSSNEYPSNVYGDVTTATAQAITIATQICAQDTASVPGYSTARKPVLIHCVAFGCLFDSTNNSSYKTSALGLLQNLQYLGGQAGGEQTSLTTPLASYKIVVGSYNQRIANLQTAFGKVMQDGVQVSLIQ